ncbi:MAG: HIRAN domain-containing protein [Tissierellia bacterium]|nr:HIRAN domain-containing protein [Tissierellia bacterium]
MSDITKKEEQSFLNLWKDQNHEIDLPKPFEREIFLFETHVAGTTHIPGIEELEPHIHEGDAFRFYREPDNPYDPMAIKIENEDGVKVGYVPMVDNVVFARLMDAGKLLFGKVVGKEIIDGWVKIYISVYLKE